MMLKRTSLLLLAVVLAVTACENGTGTGGGGATSPADGEPFIIGAATAQTGFISPFDQPALRGLELGITEVNNAGGLLGHPIELRAQDTRSDAAQSAVAAQELVDGGADALIVPCDGDLVIAAGPVGQEAQIPTISMCAAAGGFTEIVGAYQFGIFSGNNYQGGVLAQFAYDQGYRRGFWLNSNDSLFTQDLPIYWARKFEELGGEVVGNASYSLGQQDFGPIVTRIANVSPRPDVIMTSAYEPDFPAFVTQLRGAGIDIPVLASSAVDTATLPELGDVAEGLLHATLGVDEPGSSLGEFNDTFEAANGERPSGIFESTGYDTIMALKAAVEAAGSIEPQAIRDAMAELQDVQGAGGPITFAGTNRQAIRPLTIVQIRDGERVAVAEIQLGPGEFPELDFDL
jgi:branched-chain amino acid transport system substrate-binding protein